MLATQPQSGENSAVGVTVSFHVAACASLGLTGHRIIVLHRCVCIAVVTRTLTVVYSTHILDTRVIISRLYAALSTVSLILLVSVGIVKIRAALAALSVQTYSRRGCKTLSRLWFLRQEALLSQRDRATAA